MNIRIEKSRSQILTFIAVTFGFSWAIAGAIASLGGLTHPLASLLIIVFMAGPAVGALVCAGLFNKGRRFEALGLKGGMNLWLVKAWLIGLSVIGLSFLITITVPGIDVVNPANSLKEILGSVSPEAAAELDRPGMGLILLANAAIFGAAINSVILLTEELGWRGWLWDYLKSKGFWRATFVIGLLWGLWHVPLILMGHNYPSMPQIGALLFILYCVLMSPIFSYVRVKNGSVWAASVLHGTINAVAGVALMSQSNMDMPWRGTVGLGGLIVLAGVCVWVWTATRKGSDHE